MKTEEESKMEVQQEKHNPEVEEVLSEPDNQNGTKLTIKGLIVAVLILLLLIPTLFISGLVRERLKREGEVRKEVCSKWASNQTLVGPILVIPYLEPLNKNKNDTIGYNRTLMYFLPETLDISGKVTPFERHRSIFDITVYQSQLNFKGEFSIPDLKAQRGQLLLNEAYIYFNISDFRGIEDQLKLDWDNQKILLTNEMATSQSKLYGLVAPIELTPESLLRTHSFSLDIKIKGSENLMFVPVGKTTTTHLASPWKNPSFEGSFIPNDPADISKDGFVADWKILHMNRAFPQYWSGSLYDFSDSEYGVKLLKSADSYAKTERSVKYAILFIALTFALYFFIEILQKRKVHPIQYILVGMALCIFYTLLLSISEYIIFNWAYLIASVATITLITFYTKSAFGYWKIAALFGLVLAGLYGFIFILIQLQDGALLFGSIGLFILLAVIMYYSRKINWYGQNNLKTTNHD